MDLQTKIKARRLLSMMRPEVLAAHTPPAMVARVDWSGTAIQVADSWLSQMEKYNDGAMAVSVCGNIKQAALEVLPEDE